MTEIERTDLARERTHASWIRTCLSFLVALIAVRHYVRTDNINTILATLTLAGGGIVSATRAASLAPDLPTRIMAYGLIPMSIAAALLQI